MNYISLETLMNDIRDSINLLSKHNFDLVVGIPRSGMIPAYLISLYLNIDVTDVNSFILNTPIQRGSTRTSGKRIYNPHDAQRILLVDDSFSTGKLNRPGFPGEC
ncbi:phosphoribosyltransferase, partial [Shigella boydii]|uniref:phosphoribosyltransferase n=1 Tax=Shigella boydii TaxID=621 RepID=UPI001C0A8DD2